MNGGILATTKFEKSRTVSKKIQRGSLSSRQVLYLTLKLKREQMKRGPFALT